ncbi:group 10 secretory phospholipase A2 [Leucoraja erinacea]|uniref:group 10 secretory phospholipase A2 n=1 Tax=Leucoraja erinaceus TaxID=7782 RepID=UPI002454BE88|nr:group 10 secretory phospholipase A2 [Leucoraja erinacea]XP_055507124.1 group 10 secretory phospholipase A2 [Leucoraja erinacea]
MDSPLFWLLVALSVPTTSMDPHGKVQPRSIIDLAGMLRCSTGRIFSYLVYGCYCGLGGKGWPRDSTDWCCFNHDCCYGRAESAGCHPKSDCYSWSCYRTTPSCGERNTRCEKKICECDVVLSKCLKRANYQNRYALWPNFLCGYSRPKC